MAPGEIRTLEMLKAFLLSVQTVKSGQAMLIFHDELALIAERVVSDL